MQDQYFQSCFNQPNAWARIDDWIPSECDKIFKTTKGAIILPVSQFYNVEQSIGFDTFIVSTQRTYNANDVRYHICHYLNYFEKYYDTDQELLSIFYRMKLLIDIGIVENDVVHEYTKEQFVNDIRRYVLSESIYQKIGRMNNANFILELNYINKNNEGLQYTRTHGMYLMEISVLTNMLIPLICHFMYKKKMVDETDNLIRDIFYSLFNRYNNEVDLISKLYETVSTTINKHYSGNISQWEMCKIRGMDPNINSIEAVDTIITKIIPKYVYNNNIITYNYVSIKQMILYKIQVAYEYDFIKLQASKRDGEDNKSEFDKYEAYLIKSNEALFLQNKYNASKVMEIINNKFGPFDDKEVDFYYHELSKGGQIIINNFQYKLISNLFMGYFGDDMSIRTINARDYVKLIIAAKRLLLSNNLIQLPYIISGRVSKIITKNTINKKEMVKLESSELFKTVRNKYRNPKIERSILSDIAIILASDFEIIDYYQPEINGRKIEVSSDLILDEFLLYVILIK